MVKLIFFKIATILFLPIGCKVATVTGAMESSFYDSQPDYEYYANIPKSYDNDMDENVQDRVAKMRKIKEQRFMDALIMEAGRHVLYPDKYQIAAPQEKVKNIEIDEIKGQPEYMDLGMSRSSQASATSESQLCSVECSDYAPVCGSDGKVYDSSCEMRKQNCRFSNVTESGWETCRGNNFLCPSRCQNINDPVCGSDGHIYQNICVMRNKNCGLRIRTRSMKYCYAKDKESKVYGPCPEDCQEIYDPVCGTDGVIYYNECFLQMRTCGEGVKVSDNEACTQKPDCPERCIPIYDPACGSDGRIYFNHCKMLLDNCGKDIKRMPRAYCRETQVDQTPIRIVKRSGLQ